MSKIEQLQLLQQNLQTVSMQRQQVQEQLLEFESALTEIKDTPKAYKIVGKIMIEADKEAVVKDLSARKDVAKVRLKNFQVQEEKLKQNMEVAQQDAMKEMKNE